MTLCLRRVAAAMSEEVRMVTQIAVSLRRLGLSGEIGKRRDAGGQDQKRIEWKRKAVDATTVGEGRSFQNGARAKRNLRRTEGGSIGEGLVLAGATCSKSKLRRSSMGGGGNSAARKRHPSPRARRHSNAAGQPAAKSTGLQN